MSGIQRTLCSLILLITALSASAVGINGAGSPDAKPLYAAWSRAYEDVSKNGVAYDAIGASGGVRKIMEHAIDFSATDVAMSREDSAKENLICFPTSVSGVVPFVNIPGIKAGKISLTGPVLADIYMGKIKSWNDREISALNPGRELPDLAIKPVALQEGSGATYNFSDYLSRVSSDWKVHFGNNYLIQWSDDVVQAKGSDNVVKAVMSNPGAIGYADYGYVLRHQLAYVKLQNQHGNFVEPSYDGFTAALINSSWRAQATFDEMLNDKPGAETWPITAGTFVLLPKVTSNPQKTAAALRFLTWGFIHGDLIEKEIGYVRLTESLQAKIFAELTTITDTSGRPLRWDYYH